MIKLKTPPRAYRRAHRYKRSDPTMEWIQKLNYNAEAGVITWGEARQILWLREKGVA